MYSSSSTDRMYDSGTAAASAPSVMQNDTTSTHIGFYLGFHPFVSWKSTISHGDEQCKIGECVFSHIPWCFAAHFFMLWARCALRMRPLRMQ